jgi:hypothetical protein
LKQEYYLEMERSPREVIARTALILAVSGLCIAGCAENTKPSSTENVGTSFDRDGDRAMDVLDPYPDVANPTDWDVDTIPNEEDIRPYNAGTRQTDTINSGSVPTSRAPGTSEQTGPSNQVIPPKGCLNDRDCDLIPDYRDPYPDIYDPSDRQSQDDDWDDDGLPNALDSAPRNRDRDGDGKLDGYDPDPNNPNDGVNEPTDKNPYIDDKDSDGDGVDDIYDSEPRNPLED